MNDSFMFIFIFTVLALGEKCARFVHFIHGSFTELVNRERLHEHARCTLHEPAHTHYIYIYILCIWAVFIHLFREQNNHIRARSDAPTALTPDTTAHTRLNHSSSSSAKSSRCSGKQSKGRRAVGLKVVPDIYKPI